MKRISTPVAFLILIILALSPRLSLCQEVSYTPPNGFVPDAKTAIAVGTAVLIPIYGAKKIASEKLFEATLINGIWTVEGSLPKDWLGGVATIKIDKKDGHIVSVFHGK